MKGPLQVIRRRRSERQANETDTAQAATEAPTEAHPTVDSGSAAPALAASEPPPATDQQPRTPSEQPTGDVPAGQEPMPERPSFRQRGRLRRRLRYLRRVRELGFRDLGGLVFDQHKFARVSEELVHGKLSALAAVDAELRALEHALNDRRPLTELREPGISVCPRCGALHGSDARYCPSCGVPVRGPRAIGEVGEAVSLSVGQIGAIAATSAPPPSAQPPSQLTLHAEPPTQQPEPEPQPTATEVAEREAAKARAEGAPGAAQATPGAEQATPDAEQATPGAEQATPGAEQAAPESEHAAEAAPATDQPTEVMSRVDDDAANGVHDAVAQPSGERREP